MVPEAQEYKEKSISDSKTSYKVEKYGAIFTISWETVINDDLDAISRVPAMHGNAARRVQNKAVYDILFTNPTMSDGQSLFSASHASGRNTNSTTAALNVTLLNEMFAFMMLQKGQSSDAILNITPRYLLVPAALSATALELVNSQSYAQTGGNEGVINIYGVNGQRPLTVVVEPLIDGHDNGAYYLAADTSQIDTVELSFLNGEEAPVLESDLHFETDTYRYKVRQTFGAAAIDWRGLSRCT
jgi:phage major head subunit gpT-like protein